MGVPRPHIAMAVFRTKKIFNSKGAPVHRMNSGSQILKELACKMIVGKRLIGFKESLTAAAFEELLVDRLAELLS